MDRLASMAVFVKAVDLGSFAAAADALDMSGPMVGKHVRALEERLGVRLLNRTTRSQSLTEFGHAYYERCRVVLAEADAADALAADELTEPRGKLRVTMPVHFGRRCVVPVLLGLAKKHPSLQLDLSLNDRLVDLADDGVDLAIRTGPLEDRSDIVRRRVARQRMMLCAAPSYLSERGTPSTLDDLRAHRAIVYARAGHRPPWLFPRDEQAPVEIVPDGGLRLDDLDAIADAAVAGFGIAWLPDWLIRERMASGALVRVLRDTGEYLYDVYALWLKTPHLPLKTRSAVDALAQELPAAMT